MATAVEASNAGGCHADRNTLQSAGIDYVFTVVSDEPKVVKKTCNFLNHFGIPDKMAKLSISSEMPVYGIAFRNHKCSQSYFFSFWENY
jgi:hypothetical protein